MFGWLKGNVSYRVGAVMLGLVAMTIGLIGSTLVVLNTQKADGQVINLAGRQRMLSQKMTKETLAYHFSADGQQYKDALAGTYSMFDKTLGALIMGGDAPDGKGGRVTLPAATDPEVLAMLHTVESIWTDFGGSVQTVLTEDPASDAAVAARATIESNSLELLGNMNVAVGKFASISEAKVNNLRYIQFGFLIASVGLAILGWTVVRKTVIAPLRDASRALETVAEHDLTTRLEHISEDEIGVLSKSINKLITTQRDFITNIHSSSQTLQGSSGRLHSRSSHLAEDSSTLTNVANTVSAASEELSSSISGISSSAEDMSNMLNTVATAIEEMSASIKEVTKSSLRGSDIANRANQQAKQTVEIMDQLQMSSTQIGKVLEVISDIADQTNLLALNATIEAASAGEAGKGFAVVANEVKELARQTVQATEEIKRQIEGMQSSTTNAVDAINTVSEVISEVNDISQTIASAMEEQSATVTEISRSGGVANQAAQEISRRVQEGAEGTQEIVKNIILVKETASRTDSGISETKDNAVELAELADQLETGVKDFRL
jgi:methyl-accepting chemotaxis protein